ncbi:MAG: hypothetical protein OXE52_18375 [Chloroflexi bacterium]|nr:hypothetical protein [Chloroflexota bacterium]
MKAFALMLIAVLIGAMAAAGIAEDIDNCCFVDRQCNSDQDWINGWHAFENNQCGAPAQSAAQTSSQPTGGTPAQIDNCCFVDRQCNSDQDWTDGYWAFQNNQCSAPAQSAAPTSAQPVSAPGAQVDNCCFVDRQCSSDLEWMGGWHAYQNNQCAAPGQSPASAPGAPQSARIIGYTNGSIQPSTSFTRLPTLDSGPISYSNCCEQNWQCNSDEDWQAGYEAFGRKQCQLPGSVISIVGDADFVDYMAIRLEELRNGMPERYYYALRGLDKLQQASPDLLGGHVDEIGRTFFVPWSGPRTDGFETRMSAVIVHEACHVHRADAGHQAYACDLEGTIREELICREIELEVVIGLGAAPHVIEWVRGMVARTPETMRSSYPESLC